VDGAVAVIGTRTPTTHQISLAKTVARELSKKGLYIKTGGAEGIGKVAMDNTVPGKLRVYLPWYSYNRNVIPPHAIKCTFSATDNRDWLESVSKYHPNPAALRDGGVLLHARNYGVVKGTRLVVAFPQMGGGGGTGQGIRIANGLGIQVISVEPNDMALSDELMKTCLKFLGNEIVPVRAHERSIQH
jgi:hypothetical protein